MEECKSIPKAGPLEIVMAVIVIAGIGGGGYYLYRTSKTLNKVETTAKGNASGADNPNSNQTTTDETKKPNSDAK